MSDPNWAGWAPGSQEQPSYPTSQYPQPGYQAPYGAYPGPAAPQYGASSAPPRDYRAMIIVAIVGGILFSLIIGMPLSLIALGNSRRVRSRWESGDQNAALKASRSARLWMIAGIVFDVIGVLLVIALFSQSGHPAG